MCYLWGYSEEVKSLPLRTLMIIGEGGEGGQGREGGEAAWYRCYQN